MARDIFANYPGDPPDNDPDIHPSSMLAQELLEQAEVDDALIDRIVALIDDMAAQTLRECPRCAKAAYEAEVRLEEDAAAYWESAAYSII